MKNLFDGVLAAIIFLGVFKIIELLVLQKSMESLKEIFVVSVLWTVHAAVLSAGFLFLELLNIRKMIPGAILLFEGFTFLGGFRLKEIAKFMFGSW
ncbi:MAG: hypothetical protein K2G19_01810, partial [Lachnospiraceae bacterium]|nr:hypothetical protein [Lachnospiraceae bacterium]